MPRVPLPAALALAALALGSSALALSARTLAARTLAGRTLAGRALAAFEDGASAPQEGFSGLLVPTADLSFFDRHDHTASELGVQVSLVEELVTGQRCALLVLFLRAQPDDEGALELRSELVLEKPDGSLYHHQAERVAYAGPDVGRRVGLVGEYLELSFEPEDPLGEYRVRGRLIDVHGETEVELKATLRHVELEEPEPFDDAGEAGAWVQAFREHLEVTRAPAAWRALAAAGELADGSPGEAFFRALLDDNPFLFPAVRAAAADEDERVRSAALRLLGTCRSAPEQRLAGLDEDLRAACEAHAAAWDPERDAILEPAHLDLLWGTYLARGRYAPIARIASVLGREGAPGDELVAGAARWSLGSMAEQDEIVAAYARWTLEHGALEPRARAVLAELLDA